MATNPSTQQTKGGKPDDLEHKSLEPAQTDDKAVKQAEAKGDGKVKIVVAHPLAPADLGLDDSALETNQTLVRPGQTVGVEPHVAARFTGNGHARLA